MTCLPAERVHPASYLTLFIKYLADYPLERRF